MGYDEFLICAFIILTIFSIIVVEKGLFYKFVDLMNDIKRKAGLYRDAK